MIVVHPATGFAAQSRQPWIAIRKKIASLAAIGHMEAAACKAKVAALLTSHITKHARRRLLFSHTPTKATRVASHPARSKGSMRNPTIKRFWDGSGKRGATENAGAAYGGK